MTTFQLRSVGLLVALSTLTAAAQEESLKDIARRNGGTALSHVSLDGPQWPLSEMVRSADLIVRGRIVSSVSRLSDDVSLVFTDHTVTPIDILKKPSHFATSARVGPTMPIVIQQPGGVLRVDGLVLTTTTNIEDRDNPLKAGDEYVFFLSAAQSSASMRARPGVYESVTGPLGIFPVRNGKVQNFTRHAAGVRPLPTDDLPGFAAMIRTLIGGDKR